MFIAFVWLLFGFDSATEIEKYYVLMKNEYAGNTALVILKNCTYLNIQIMRCRL